MAKKLYYKIGEACKLLDIQPYVLRYWETEFPPLAPTKSKSGQRVYSEQDLAVIRRIKELLYDEGYTIAGAKKRLENEGSEPGKEEGAATAQSAARPKKKGSGVAAKAAASAGGKAPPTKAGDRSAATDVDEVRRVARDLLDEARDLLALLDGDA